MKKIISLLILISAFKANATLTILSITESMADIGATVNSAASSAADGDTLYFPYGNYKCTTDVYITKRIHLLGAVNNFNLRTRIYRPSTMTDASLYVHYMVHIDITSKSKTLVTVSYIDFAGKTRTITAKDGGSDSQDHLLRITKCNGFVVHHCNFYNAGNSALYIKGYDDLQYGLVDYCNFIDCSSAWNGMGLGYGIVIYGDGTSWITNDDLGNVNSSIYVQHCYFTNCRHGIASNNGAKYVCRDNRFYNCYKNAPVDMHESPSANVAGCRSAEVYRCTFTNDGLPFRTVANAAARAALAPFTSGDQYIVQTDDSSTWKSTGTSAGNWTQCTIGNGLLPITQKYGAPRKDGVYGYYDVQYYIFANRGGTTVFFNNYVNIPARVVFNYEDQYGVDGTYPYFGTGGYDSQTRYASNHTSTTDPNKGSDDCYEWNNNIFGSEGFAPDAKYNFVGPQWVNNRDVHTNTVRPDYTPAGKHPLEVFVK